MLPCHGRFCFVTGLMFTGRARKKKTRRLPLSHPHLSVVRAVLPCPPWVGGVGWESESPCDCDFCPHGALRAHRWEMSAVVGLALIRQCLARWTWMLKQKC